MEWIPVRFHELKEGDVFRKKNEVYIHEGDGGAVGGLTDFYLLEPVQNNLYCEGEDDCEHFMVDGVMYHRSLGEEVDGEIIEPMYSIRKRDTTNMNMKVEKLL